MRLSVFHCRASPVFPSACQDLEQRRDVLEDQWRKLEADAESLRRELGEDKWILVFRNAGRQALKMCESVTRSFNKLKEAAETGEHQTNPPAFAKKIESYEAKKTHYGPALERVLAIIDRGVLDRLTVNGEILRLQSDMKRLWNGLQSNMKELDAKLEEIGNEGREKQLRDSVSTVMSSERSVATSGSIIVDTPGTSPASSVVGTSRKNSLQGSRTPTPLTVGKTRQSSYSSLGKATSKAVSTRVVSGSSIPKRIPLTRSGELELLSAASTPPPMTMRTASKPETPVSNKPRWISMAKTESRDFLPLSALEPSPYAKGEVTPRTNFLRAGSRALPTPVSAPSRSGSSMNGGRPLSTRASSLSISRPASAMLQPGVTTQRKSSLPVPSITTTPSVTRSPLAPKTSTPALRPASRSFGNGNAATPSGRRSSVLPQRLPNTIPDGNEADTETRRPALAARRSSQVLAPRTSSSPSTASRIPSRSGRRSSMLSTRPSTAVTSASVTDSEGNDADSESPLHYKTRPVSVIGNGVGRRRSSLLTTSNATTPRPSSLFKNSGEVQEVEVAAEAADAAATKPKATSQ
jgi:hypothetical protein